MKIGLFFGSFNPIHNGHMIIAHLIKETTDIKKIWFVVSPQNPLKKSKNLLHEFDRYDLVQVATKDDYDFKVSDIEFNLPKPSYTVDTLIYLQEKHPDHDFMLIIGEDNLDSFPKWKNHREILSNHGLIVYPRPRGSNSPLKQHDNVTVVEAPRIDISATMIRKLVKERKSIKYLVPESVRMMIESKGFFV